MWFRRVFSGVGLLVPVGQLLGCGQGVGASPAKRDRSCTTFTWSDYVGPDLIAEFERRSRKVVIDTFSSNEELLAIGFQSGATGYDVARSHRISWWRS